MLVDARIVRWRLQFRRGLPSQANSGQLLPVDQPIVVCVVRAHAHAQTGPVKIPVARNDPQGYFGPDESADRLIAGNRTDGVARLDGPASAAHETADAAAVGREFGRAEPANGVVYRLHVREARAGARYVARRVARPDVLDDIARRPDQAPDRVLSRDVAGSVAGLGQVPNLVADEPPDRSLTGNSHGRVAVDHRAPKYGRPAPRFRPCRLPVRRRRCVPQADTRRCRTRFQPGSVRLPLHSSTGPG